MLSGSSFAAVLRDDKMEGVFYASDLIRYFMYLGTESMSDYASFLVPAPEYSNEDRRVYELRVPEAELANMDILPTALMLVAADKHLAQQGCLDCALSSSSFFYPEQITQVGRAYALYGTHIKRQGGLFGRSGGLYRNGNVCKGHAHFYGTIREQSYVFIDEGTAKAQSRAQGVCRPRGVPSGHRAG